MRRTPQACVACAELVSKLRAAVSGGALAPDGSAAETTRANCPAFEGCQGTRTVLWAPCWTLCASVGLVGTHDV